MLAISPCVRRAALPCLCSLNFKSRRRERGGKEVRREGTIGRKLERGEEKRGRGEEGRRRGRREKKGKKGEEGEEGKREREEREREKRMEKKHKPTSLPGLAPGLGGLLGSD